MAKPFKALRDLMHIEEVTQADLSKLLLLSHASVSSRMMAKQPWTLEECYAILEYLHQPAHRLHELFPRGGINDAEVKRAGRAGYARRIVDRKGVIA